MIKTIQKLINNSSIRSKLFLSYLILIVFPLFLFIMITSFISSKDTENKTLESAKKVLSQASAFLEYKSSNIKSVMDIVVLDSVIQDIATRDSAYYRNNIGNGWIDTANFDKITFNIRGNSDVKDIHFYMWNGIASMEETNEFMDLNNVQLEKWYKTLLNTKASFVWLPSSYFPDSTNKNQLYFIKKIPNSSSIDDFIGVIKLDIDEDVIKSILNKALFTKSTSAYLTNSNNELISFSTKADYSGLDLISKTSPDDAQKVIWKQIVIKKEKMLLGVESIGNTDMKLSIIIPYKDIFALSVRLRNQMMLILIITISLIIPLSFFVSDNETKKIRHLTKHMKKIQNGDISILHLHYANDEIGDLILNFNYMIEKLKVLINDNFKLGKKLKNIELIALQAQINPHFLYNTLDLINWMSMKYEAPKIAELVNLLSKFYKLSLRKGEDIVTIESEMNHAIAYLMIQNMRFEDKISYVIDIPSELYKYSIPKITFQPIIENSILHGILEKEEEAGTIKISGEIKDNILSICIEDDGIGMEEALISNINNLKSKGYGIVNIDDRLKLIYGPSFGLFYSSVLNKGTKVIIKVPAEEIHPAQ